MIGVDELGLYLDDSDTSVEVDGESIGIDEFGVWVEVALLSGAFARDVYDALEPYQHAEEELGDPLAVYIGGIGSMFDWVSDIVRDSPEGPGWSALLDIDRAPPEALAWLAQFPGVRLRPGLSDAEQRERIRSTDGMKRGSPGAFRAAAKQYLTGDKYVVIRERFNHEPYQISVVTLDAETPDDAKVLAALNEQKPGGLKLFYESVAGASYALIAAAYDTYADLLVEYETYDEMSIDVP